MKIEIVVDPSRPAPAASLAARVAPPPAAAAPEAVARLVSSPPDDPILLGLNLPTLISLFWCVEMVDALVGDAVEEGQRGRAMTGRRRRLPTSMRRWR